jgi:hypothetical protein
MKPSEYVRLARDEIAKGWCKQIAEDTQGNVCAIGALSRATIGNHLKGVRALGALNAKALELGYEGIVSMNDDVDIIQQDMLDLFEKVAIGLEEQGL